MISNIDKQVVLKSFNKLSECKNKNYLFRTRLERILIKVKKYGDVNNESDIVESANKIESKLNYICDSSNVTSNGNSMSFELLKEDIDSLKNMINVTIN